MKGQVQISVPCGFLLSVCHQPPLVRHYGLHLLENAIKYHWPNMSDEDKQYVKVSVACFPGMQKFAGIS